MASTIKVKRSSSSGAAPNTTHISTGEIALNTADGILYSSDGSSVFEIGANLTSLAVNGDTTFTSADAGSTAGPEFKLHRNSSSPADGDYLGQIKFAGESDTGVERNYAKITGKIGDATNGTEDGIIEIAHIKAGSQNINVRMTSTEFKIMNGTDFDVETHDGSSNGLRLNGTLVTSTAAELNRLDGISSAAVGETDSQTLTNKTLTSPSIGTGFTFDGITFTTAQTSAESFADNDTSLMTSAAIADKIESYGYSTTTGDITGVTAGTGLSGGGASGAVTLNIDSTVATLTGSQTLTNKTLTSPSIGTGFTLDSVTIGTIQTSGESFADNDTSLMTSAAIDDRINAAGGGASALNDLSDAKTLDSGQTIGIGTNALANDDGSDNFNTALGYKAGEDITSGTGGVFVGYEAGLQATTSNYPVAIGYEAIGTGVMTGTDNIGIGRQAGNDLTSGTYNFFAGYNAGFNATTADSNIAIGRQAIGLGVLTGTNNVVLGYQAGYDLTSGDHNIFSGFQAGANVTTGTGNIFQGNEAGEFATTASYGIAIGYEAIGTGVMTGNDNTAIGRIAGHDLTSGTHNNFIGYFAGANATTATNTIAIGTTALSSGVLTGTDNIAIGRLAGNDLTSGAYNNFIGYTSGANATTGKYNVAIGYAPINTGVLTGDDNIAIGRLAGQDLTSGEYNFFGGYSAGLNATTANYSVAIGSSAIGTGVMTGTDNTAIGQSAGNDLTSGTYNNFMGYRAGYNATEANNTIAIGKNAIGLGVLTGDDNVAIGQFAGYDLTSGASNVFVGYSAGGNVTTGADNTFLGPAAGDALTTGSNNIIIGHDAAASAVDVSNEITLGDANITDVRIPGVGFYINGGDVGIGQTSPSAKLDIVGTANETVLEITSTDNNTAQAFTGVVIDTNMTGSGATGADREHFGLYIDTDSSATGGDTSNEHRVRGLRVDTDVTGDSDLVTGIYNTVRTAHSSGTITQSIAAYNLIEADGSAGVTNAYASYNLAYSGGVLNSGLYGVFGRSLLQSGHTNDGSMNMYGGYFEVDTTASINVSGVSNMYAVYAFVDDNDTASANSFCFYGTSDGGSTTNYGIYIAAGTTINYLTGELRVTGDVTAFYSDERLKDFDGTIPNALDKVKSLNGYYYYENEKAKEYGYDNPDRQVGLSAQEVEKVLPEVIAEAPINTEYKTDYKTVKYEKMIPLLVEAMKEQQEQIEKLTAEIEKLKR
jgi:hypothetical protein